LSLPVARRRIARTTARSGVRVLPRYQRSDVRQTTIFRGRVRLMVAPKPRGACHVTSSPRLMRGKRTAACGGGFLSTPLSPMANLEEQEARTAGLSSQDILELASLRKPTARMAVQFRRPRFLKKCWLRSARSASSARRRRRRRWPGRRPRPGRRNDGAEACGAAAARHGPMASSQAVGSHMLK
jgi:hypothetical protein